MKNHGCFSTPTDMTSKVIYLDMKHPLIRIVAGLFFSTILLVTLFLVHDILLLRGREVQLVNTFFHEEDANSDYGDYIGKNEELAYLITPLEDGQFFFRIENTSNTPFYLTMYEYGGWEYQLDEEKLFWYARRLELMDSSKKIVDHVNHGFDCGTGLGVTLIRPREVFERLITLEELSQLADPMTYLKMDSDSTVVDILTGQIFRSPTGSCGSSNRAMLCQQLLANEFSVRFSFRVMSYWRGEISDVYSNPIYFSREDVLRCY
ncbi:MAG: hypothetical protein AAGF89_07610 [Bacteroidota bacterium]